MVQHPCRIAPGLGFAQFVEGYLHRVDRLDRTGQHAQFRQFEEFAGQRRIRASGWHQHPPVGQGEFGDPHPVLRQRASLVGAQRGSCTQCLDRRGLAGQYPFARHAHCAHRHEDRQHYREFFRQHRHAKGNPGQRRIQPVAAHQAVQHGSQQAGCRAEDRETHHQLAGLLLQPRRFGFQGRQNPADTADFAPLARGRNNAQAAAAHHQRAGINTGPVIPAGAFGFGRRGRVCGNLAHGNGFPGQQGFVHLQPVACHQPAIGRNTVSFVQHHKIAPHHLAGGDPLALAIANHQRARAGQVAQGFQCAFGARLLHHGDDDREAGKGHQDQRFVNVAQGQVNSARHQQQHQHRFAQHIHHNGKGASFAAVRQFVEALCAQALGRLRCGQARASCRGLCHAMPPARMAAASAGATGRAAHGPATVSVATIGAMPAAASAARSSGDARQWVATALTDVAPAR